MLKPKSLMILVIVVVSFLVQSSFADTGDSILVIFDGSGITGGTGWIDDGTIVRLATETDSVGIGTTMPSEKLDVNGRIKMSQQTAPSTTADKLYNTGGNLFWNGAQLTGGGGILPTGTSGQTLRHSGSGWSAVDNLFNDGTNIGIGTTTPVSVLQIVGNSNEIARFTRGSSTDYSNQFFSITENVSGTTLLSNSATINQKPLIINVANSGGGTPAGDMAMNFQIGGTSAMYINSSGNIGIGTSSPSANLHIAGSTAWFLLQTNTDANHAISLLNTAANKRWNIYQIASTGSPANGLFFEYYDGATYLPRMVINSSGNVGIGTTNPRGPLDIKGWQVNPLSGYYTDINHNSYYSSGWKSKGGGPGSYIRMDGGNQTGYNSAIRFWVSPEATSVAADASLTFNEVMTIINNGNVGIGTTAPTDKLNVVGDVCLGVDAIITSADTKVIRGADSNNNSAYSGYGTNLKIRAGDANSSSGMAATGGNLELLAGNAHQVSSTSNGNAGNVLIKAGYNDLGGGSKTYGRIKLYTGTTTVSERVTIDENGKVGIGTTSPGTYALSVVGTAGLSTGTAWTNTSDRRFKNIEGELKGIGLKKVMSLHPISYTWNELHRSKYGDDPGLNYGFIAQEVKEVIPEFITQDSDGYYYYNPSGMEAILTSAIQEQQQIVETQQTQLLTQQTQIEFLQKQVDELKAIIQGK